MKRAEDISILITDKNFQKLLPGWAGFTEEEKAEVYREYELTAKDIEILQQLWLGLDFHPSELSSEIIESALDETIWKVAERNNVTTRKIGFQKVYEQFSKIAAILIIPILLYTTYFQFFKTDASEPVGSQQIITVNSQPGTISNLTLPDGSKVYLNAESTISYPNFFIGEKREVSISGEAYFEVVKNREMPMEISSGNVKLKVYGTSFNVNAYQDEESAKITLVEGSVSLSSSLGRFNGKEEFFIEPGQTVTFYSNSKKLEVENKDIFLYTAWKDGLLVFKNTSFESVLKLLSRRFNIDIELVSKNLASIPMDATFRDENINEILRLLSLGTSFKYYYGPQHKLPDGTFEKSRIYIENK
ncbi:MAG: hypothetical protein A2W90_05250 [Bacteroidetes bacterium GWF2_42_66]|nr:MAG: hypothetical protein A2W92_03425 [Bacteroidetes bacterium GWA2_42_15]OFX95986.1 MAG: hypothetical protein A2W89_02660 [Bacteroidetes bacterium GWE2_42_39]OFY46559.1 MAG: hypothetical protein A2W90_05250 [Bacteroidetes bacterium GWF2_42_66]HBL75585.1 hypothetical protein [Prolixibacteraceae bacterium]HCR91045.1 hypothetical protein [Prolixibacteraceae bacterium]